jgi:hypothetical protein
MGHESGSVSRRIGAGYTACQYTPDIVKNTTSVKTFGELISLFTIFAGTLNQQSDFKIKFIPILYHLFQLLG